MNDPEEVRLHCAQCNGYLYSVSIHDHPPKDRLLLCPMKLDSRGKCTGNFKDSTP